MNSALVELLSDGRFHSGEALAKHLAISRTSVWKQIEELKSVGLDIFSVKGKGYKIPGGIDLLDHSLIEQTLRTLLRLDFNLEVFSSIASTNQYLASKESEQPINICLSEYQYAGRGRRGRQWHSPFARNIYLSIKLSTESLPEKLSAISLVVAYIAAQTLKSNGVEAIKIKWPNDLIVDDAKVGGILLELQSRKSGFNEIIIGLGLNWDMPQTEEIDQNWRNLKPYCSDTSRNDLVIELCKNIISGCLTFLSEMSAQKERLSKHISLWDNFDYLKGKPITVLRGGRTLSADYLGIAEDGRLVVDYGQGPERLTGGEVSVRVTDKQQENT